MATGGWLLLLMMMTMMIVSSQAMSVGKYSIRHTNIAPSLSQSESVVFSVPFCTTCLPSYPSPPHTRPLLVAKRQKFFGLL